LALGRPVGPKLGLGVGLDVGPLVGVSIIGMLVAGDRVMGDRPDGAGVGAEGVVDVEVGSAVEGADEAGSAGVGTEIVGAVIGAMGIGTDVDGKTVGKSVTGLRLGAIVPLVGATATGDNVVGLRRGDIVPIVGVTATRDNVEGFRCGAIVPLGAASTGDSVDGDTVKGSGGGLCIGAVDTGANVETGISATIESVGTEVVGAVGGNPVGVTATGAPVDGDTTGVAITGGSEDTAVGGKSIGATLIAGGAGEMNIGDDLKGTTETGILAGTGVTAIVALGDGVVPGTARGDSDDGCGSSSMILEITFTISPASSYVALSRSPQSVVTKFSMLVVKSFEFTTVTFVLKSEQNTSVVSLLTLYCALTDMSDSCFRIAAVKVRDDTFSLSVSITKKGSDSGHPSQYISQSNLQNSASSSSLQHPSSLHGTLQFVATLEFNSGTHPKTLS
jgi:hypothetical protein